MPSNRQSSFKSPSNFKSPHKRYAPKLKQEPIVDVEKDLFIAQPSLLWDHLEGNREIHFHSLHHKVNGINFTLNNYWWSDESLKPNTPPSYYLPVRPIPVDSFIRTNIKRGNTFIQLQLSNKGYEEAQWARKGMGWIHSENVLLTRRQNEQAENNAHLDCSIGKDIEKVLFGQAFTAPILKSPETVNPTSRLVGTELIHGIDAQISYHSQLGAWVIGSGTRTIIAQNIADVTYYAEALLNEHMAPTKVEAESSSISNKSSINSSSCQNSKKVKKWKLKDQVVNAALNLAKPSEDGKLVLQVAEEWFYTLGQLTPQRRTKLSQLLVGFTLIGKMLPEETINRPIASKKSRKSSAVNAEDTANMVTAPSWNSALIFYARVDHCDSHLCLCPLQTKKLIEKEGLRFVNVFLMERFKFQSKESSFSTILQEFFRKIRIASLDDKIYCESGCVVHLLSTSIPQQKKARFSTNAFILRKQEDLVYQLMERVSVACVRDGIHKIEAVKQFKSILIGERSSSMFELPWPNNHYSNIFTGLLDLIEALKLSHNQVESQFWSLIRLTMYMIAKRLPIDEMGSKLFGRRVNIQILKQIPFSVYGAIGCQTKIIYYVYSLCEVFSKSYYRALEQNLKNIEQPIPQLFFDFKQGRQKIIEQLLLPGKLGVPCSFYFLDSKIPYQEAVSLVGQLRNIDGTETFFKLMVMREEGPWFRMKEDNYPFSIESIFTSYSNSFVTGKEGKKTSEQIKQFKQITLRLKATANISFENSPNYVEIIELPFVVGGRINLPNGFAECLERVFITEQAHEDKEYCILAGKVKAKQFRQVDGDIYRLAEIFIQHTFKQLPQLPEC